MGLHSLRLLLLAATRVARKSQTNSHQNSHMKTAATMHVTKSRSRPVSKEITPAWESLDFKRPSLSSAAIMCGAQWQRFKGRTAKQIQDFQRWMSSFIVQDSVRWLWLVAHSSFFLLVLEWGNLGAWYRLSESLVPGGGLEPPQPFRVRGF